MRFDQYILEDEFCFRISKYEKFLHNLKVYQAWNKLWSGYILCIYLSLSFFLVQWCKLQLGVLYICDHRGKSKLFTKQTRHNHKFLGSCELKAPLYIYMSTYRPTTVKSTCWPSPIWIWLILVNMTTMSVTKCQLTCQQHSITFMNKVWLFVTRNKKKINLWIVQTPCCFHDLRLIRWGSHDWWIEGEYKSLL